jgi:hypothetical protein
VEESSVAKDSAKVIKYILLWLCVTWFSCYSNDIIYYLLGIGCFYKHCT